MFGFILLVVGILLQKFPPDYSTQRFIGYRTFKSQRDEKSWNKGNKLAAQYLIIFAFGNLLVGILLLTIHISSSVFAGIITYGLIALTIFLLFFFVERQL